MDPNATLFWLLEAIRKGDVEEAKYYAESLSEWVQKGGFPPKALEECLRKSGVEAEAQITWMNSFEKK